MQGKRNNVSGEKRAADTSGDGQHSSVPGHEQTASPKVGKH